MEMVRERERCIITVGTRIGDTLSDAHLSCQHVGAILSWTFAVISSAGGARRTSTHANLLSLPKELFEYVQQEFWSVNAFARETIAIHRRML
jgi:hypothetical protein